MQETSVVAVAKKGCYGYYLCITICTGCGLASSAVLRIFSMHYSVFTVWFFVVLLLKIQIAWTWTLCSSHTWDYKCYLA